MPAEPILGSSPIRAQWNELAAQIPLQWVAATDQGVVASAPRLQEVVDTVVSLGLRGEVAFAFINSPITEGGASPTTPFGLAPQPAPAPQRLATF